MSKAKSIEKGTRFGTLCVVSDCYSYNGRMACDCQCDCGTTGRRMLKDLLAGKTTNCGCLKGPRFAKITSVSGSENPNWKGHGEISLYVWRGWRDQAKKREIPFDITIEWAWDLFLKQDRKCAISGVPIRFAEKTGRYSDKTASLDRIDSTNGYVVGNVWWIHKDLNFMKHKNSLDDLLKWCRLIVEYQDRIKLA